MNFIIKSQANQKTITSSWSHLSPTISSDALFSPCPKNPKLHEITQGSMCHWMAISYLHGNLRLKTSFLIWSHNPSPLNLRNEVVFWYFSDYSSWQLKSEQDLLKKVWISSWLINLLDRARGSGNVSNGFSTYSSRVENTNMFQLERKSKVVLNFCQGLYNKPYIILSVSNCSFW